MKVFATTTRMFPVLIDPPPAHKILQELRLRFHPRHEKRVRIYDLAQSDSRLALAASAKFPAAF